MCTKLSNTEKFISKAIKVHNDKYSYEKVDYKKSGEKVQIICKIHGVFNQTPENHLYGYGCKVCGTESSITKQRTSLLNFIVNAKKIHKDKYNYDLVEYNGCKNKVKIKCNKHNITFFQTPDLHLRGSGCTLCGKETVSIKNNYDTETFINKSLLIHKNKYDYSLVKYVKARLKVKILCKEHGIFEQTADSHLSGVGCKKCGIIKTQLSLDNIFNTWSDSQWTKQGLQSKNFDSFKVYIIKCWNEEEEFYKIGKSFKKIKNRFLNKATMPYNYKILKEITDESFNICKLEHLLQHSHKEFKYLPKIKFGGMYECFSKIDLELVSSNL
jgi:hypothetical protein